MRVMVIGGGGREHAVIKKLKQNKSITALYALPGNGGIAGEAVCVNIGATDLEAQVRFAVENNIDYAVVTPDDPLCLGAVDMLTNAGIPCFGPNRAAAVIEGSKVFSKNLMKKYGIPSAEYAVFDNAEEALLYLKTASLPAVIKADGPALGKGVVIAETRKATECAVRDMIENRVFGKSGERIVIEEFLTGPEVSVLSFTDGETILPMVSSMDHKRALDGDRGLNTGGMGTVAPNPYYTPEIAELCMQKIFLPTVRAMNAEGRTFRGCLYFGLMLTPTGPKVIEYNCRFGDPEAQVVLPLLESDLFTIMRAVTNGTLADTEVRFKNDAAACVIMASDGYPKAYRTGFEIQMEDSVRDSVFVAGAESKNGRLVTSGGRVLGVTATAPTLEQALRSAYEKVEKISFKNAYYRKDIGAKALLAGKEN